MRQIIVKQVARSSVVSPAHRRLGQLGLSTGDVMQRLAIRRKWAVSCDHRPAEAMRGPVLGPDGANASQGICVAPQGPATNHNVSPRRLVVHGTGTAPTGKKMLVVTRVERRSAAVLETVACWRRGAQHHGATVGLSTVGPYTPELDEVFVDLSVVPRPPHQVASGLLVDPGADPSTRSSIWDLLQREDPTAVVVVGGPGSGKTTMLRSIARQLAGRPDRRRRPLPILLTLRDCAPLIADDNGVTLPQALRASLPPLPAREPPQWWEQQLLRGRCVVLLDGLDEAAFRSDHADALAWIEAQLTTFPRNDFVITSRPYGYRADVIANAQVVQLRPFTDVQVQRFLQAWYRAVERHATRLVDASVDARADEHAADLIYRLVQVPALRDLAVNPLLLTMIANVHRYRGALPGSRADLYAEIVQVMLWRRAEAKGLPSPLPGVWKERFLAQLAYTMMQQRETVLPATQVLAALNTALRQESDVIPADDVLRELVNGGLLVERERELYAIVHRTLQEYLAAQHIERQALADTLRAKVDDPWWRETTVFWAGRADASPVVKACLRSGTVEALTLAADCVEVGEVESSLRTMLDEYLSEGFKPDAQPSRRQLTAGVLASRYAGRLVNTPSGTRLTTEPVPQSLFGLFVLDARRPAEPPLISVDDSRPALCRRAADALAFTDWINALDLQAGRRVFRLPTRAELDLIAGEPAGPVPYVARGAGPVWIDETHGHDEPTLWQPPDTDKYATAGVIILTRV
jgi:NACHT domain